MTAAGVLITLAVAAGGEVTGVVAAPLAAVQDTACITMNTENLPLETRQSPLDSLTFTVGGYPVKLCYSRPSARGRAVFGVLVPYRVIWRTGANEPTMIHTVAPINVMGIRLSPGSYSLYTVPDEGSWEIIVNRSTSQWGHESNYTDDLRAQEVGRARVSSEQLDRYVEALTFRIRAAGDAAVLLMLEWERTVVVIPIKGG